MKLVLISAFVITLSIAAFAEDKSPSSTSVPMSAVGLRGNYGFRYEATARGHLGDKCGGTITKVTCEHLESEYLDMSSVRNIDICTGLCNY